VILTCGYHGFHDWFMALDANVRGVPRALAGLVASFEYNDLASLEALFEKHSVAAVVMEPTKRVEPAPGFLAGVRELCDRRGSLLVFDEVVTAFRVDRSSAQALYGVLPDLTCLGKAMGNGMPLSAITGPRRFMQHFSSVGVGMTYEGGRSRAAARACMNILATSRRGAFAEPAKHARRVRRRSRELGIDAELTGHPRAAADRSRDRAITSSGLFSPVSAPRPHLNGTLPRRTHTTTMRSSVQRRSRNAFARRRASNRV
jgi:glutamate-1-semialdehyde aminotransferase